MTAKCLSSCYVSMKRVKLLLGFVNPKLFIKTRVNGFKTQNSGEGGEGRSGGGAGSGFSHMALLQRV